MTWAGSLAPLRRREFAWFFASRTVQLFGSTMGTIALTFAVLDLTDSASALGQVLAAKTIPLVLFLLYGGVLADRFSRTVVIQVSNITAGLSGAGLAWLFLSGHAELGPVIALTAVNGIASAAAFPAMQAAIPQLVPREQLQSANALMSLSRNALTVLGPSIGALLVVTIGPGWALAVDAVAFFVSALLLLPVALPRTRQGGTTTSTLHELREGWGYFWRTPWLWIVVVTFGALNMIFSGAWLTLGPAIAEDTIGKQGWGLVLSAESAGLLLTSVALLRIPLGRPLLWGMLGCSLMSVPILVLGVQPHLVALILVGFLAGAGIEVFGLGWSLAMQENVPASMLSRAYSYDALGSFAAIPLGQLAFGPLGSAVGTEQLMVASGAAYLVIALLPLLSGSVRGLRRRPATASAVSQV